VALVNFETLLSAGGDRRLRVGLIGVGEFGATLVAQARAIPRLELVALADRDRRRPHDVLAPLALTARARDCADARAVDAAINEGSIAVAEDSAALLDAGLDVIVEATGQPEAGALNAVRAIRKRKHVVLVSKETDSAVGPFLADLARRHGVICTPVEGDQPALLIQLVSWARVLGLEIVALGKSSEYDFVWDARDATVRYRGKVFPAPYLGALWDLDRADPGRTLAARSLALAALPQRSAPDYCEMCLVANATGFLPDRGDFHAAIARTVELPELLKPRADGGILARDGAIEVFNVLRRHDEASFAGGVFVVVRCPDAKTAAVLAGKGIPVDRAGRHMLLYNPSHLLGVEAPMTILLAGLLGRSSGAVAPRPVGDVVAVATRDLARGTPLVLDARHAIDGIAARLEKARGLAPNAPVPFYLAAGNLLACDVAAGTTLTVAMIERPARSPLWEMREEQDLIFGMVS
jgi:predicted homoserine dehydrogenase-like protein